MNGDEAQQAGFAEHTKVTVKADAGQMDDVEVIYGAVRSGAALMFYPEVNAIFKAHIDPKSGTPAFKRVPAVIYRST
jgi:hypothetical protein